MPSHLLENNIGEQWDSTRTGCMRKRWESYEPRESRGQCPLWKVCTGASDLSTYLTSLWTLMDIVIDKNLLCVLGRFLGIKFKSVTFKDSVFKNCTFEDVTSVNTYFKNCTFIDTVFDNTGRCATSPCLGPHQMAQFLAETWYPCVGKGLWRK